MKQFITALSVGLAAVATLNPVLKRVRTTLTEVADKGIFSDETLQKYDDLKSKVSTATDVVKETINSEASSAETTPATTNAESTQESKRENLLERVNKVVKAMARLAVAVLDVAITFIDHLLDITDGLRVRPVV